MKLKPTDSTFHWTTIWTFLAVLMISAAAHGQPKPPPGSVVPAGDGPKPPPTATVATEPQLSGDQRQQFTRWYNDRGQPRILILVGMDSRPSEASPQGRVGDIGGARVGARGVGGKIALWDPSGVTEQLQTAIGVELTKLQPGIRLIDMDSMAELDRRKLAIIEANDEETVLLGLATSMRADYILYVKLQPYPPDEPVPAGRRYPYKGVAMWKDYQWAGNIPIASFDWDGSRDNRVVRRYAIALAEEAAKSIGRHHAGSPGGAFYNVEIVGITEDQAFDMMDAITDIRNVVREPRMDMVRNEGEMIAKFEVLYPGQLNRLVRDIRRASDREFNTPLTIIDLQQAEAVLRFGERKPEDRPDWWRITAGEGDQADAFKTFYGQANRPKVGVMIHHMIRPEQASWPLEYILAYNFRGRLSNLTIKDVPDGIYKVQTGQPDTRSTTVSANIGIGMVQMEGHLANWLASSGATVVRGDMASRAMNQHLEEAAGRGDARMSDILRHQDGFDLMLHVWAYAQGRDDAAAQNIQYVFRLDDVRTGTFIASANWPDMSFNTDGLERDDFDARKPEDIARYAVGRLLSRWAAQSASRQDVVVSVQNAGSLDQVQAIADAMRTLPGVSITRAPTYQDGLGEMTLSHAGTYHDLLVPATNQAARFPFSVQTVGANASRIVLRVEPAHEPAEEPE
ncbi:MAG: hypothetical protein JJU36_05500 [Phycisphaeraceae bacterium]|nr:hypothetical protein [Phycisphaeraceae bacterium]